MKPLFLAAILATAATAGSADVGPVFLPDFSFPTSPPDTVISTQGCLPTSPCTN